MRPPWWVENQLLGNTESGVSSWPKSSNTCTVTPAPVSASTQPSNSSRAMAAMRSSLSVRSTRD